jgi:acyl-coenzyme A thioesterase PaaI-like protein
VPVPAGRVVSPLVTQPDPATGPALLAPLVLPPDVVPAAVAADAPAPGSSLGQHYHRCYGCGNAVPGGLHMRFTVGDGVQVVSEFVVTDEHEGAAGLAHGGLLAAALDETQATLLWLLRVPAVTVRLETDFVAPVPVGSTVRIEATCLGIAGRKIYTAARGLLAAAHRRSGSGPRAVAGSRSSTLVLRAAALFVEVPVEHFTAFGRPDLVAASMNRPVEPGAERIEVNP